MLSASKALETATQGRDAPLPRSGAAFDPTGSTAAQQRHCHPLEPHQLSAVEARVSCTHRRSRHRSPSRLAINFRRFWRFAQSQGAMLRVELQHAGSNFQTLRSVFS